MDLETVRLTARRVLESPFARDALRVSWHSGEPMVLRPSYYQACIDVFEEERQAAGRDDVDLTFDLQTNATLIDEEWVAFLTRMGGRFTLGVSCDGPAELHDSRRRNWGGAGSHAATERGMRMLLDAGVPFDVTAVVSPEVLEEPEAFFAFFADYRHGIREFHYNLQDAMPEGFEAPGGLDEYRARYADFLKGMLASVSGEDGARIPQIRNLSMFYRQLLSEDGASELSAHVMNRPFANLSVEMDGDVTTFYAGLTKDECGDLIDLYGDGRGLVIGNVRDQSLQEMGDGQKLKRIAKDFEVSRNACSSQCAYFELCSGGYDLTKLRRFGRFDVAQTPECTVQVQTFADVVTEDLRGPQMLEADAPC